jgi:uncharacterized membrane protein HdeD (DUF308 family)
LLLLASPAVHIVGIASVVGAYALLAGLMLVILALNLRALGKRIGERPAGLDHVRSQSQNS